VGRKDVSIELIDRGFATVYTGGGAEYCGNKQLLDQKQATAKRKRVGIWSQQPEDIVSPAQYKLRQALNYGGVSAAN
jgi:endonuclease YncB( thermonuclease family)